MPKAAAKKTVTPAAKKAAKTTGTKSSASASSKAPPAKKTSSPKKPQVAATKSSDVTAAKPTKGKAAPRSPATVAVESASAKAYSGPAKVCTDHQRRTCIELDRTDDSVKYIALDVENGLDVAVASAAEFDERFKPLAEYPVEKAAQLYVEYARGLGASERAMSSLGTITNVTQEDKTMAAKKSAARKAAPVKTESKGKAPAKKKAAKKSAAPAKKEPAAKKAPAAKKEGNGSKGGRGPSAASRFQELLLEKGAGGKCAHTDDQIFAKVQKEFGLDDSKRTYVKWYRNYLTKNGHNPPAARE